MNGSPDPNTVKWKPYSQTILQREHATCNATMTVTMTMLMIMTMTVTMTMTMNMTMTITMTMDMTTFAICHCHSLVIWWGRMDVGWGPVIFHVSIFIFHV